MSTAKKSDKKKADDKKAETPKKPIMRRWSQEEKEGLKKLYEFCVKNGATSKEHYVSAVTDHRAKYGLAGRSVGATVDRLLWAHVSPPKHLPEQAAAKLENARLAAERAGSADGQTASERAMAAKGSDATRKEAASPPPKAKKVVVAKLTNGLSIALTEQDLLKLLRGGSIDVNLNLTFKDN